MEITEIIITIVIISLSAVIMYLEKGRGKLKREKEALLVEKDNNSICSEYQHSRKEQFISSMKQSHDYQIQVLTESNKANEKVYSDCLKKILTCGTITQAHGVVKDALKKMEK